MDRMGRTKVLCGIAGTLNLFFGGKTARRVCNKLAGEEWVFKGMVYDPEVGRVAGRGFILLPGGCSWEGCTFCSYKSAVEKYTGGQKVPAEEFLLLFNTAFALLCNDPEVEVLEIRTGGSFFKEIPSEVRFDIFRQIANSPYIRKVRVESLPKFIRDDEIRKAVEILGGKKLDIAIGFETQDDFLRKRLGKLPVMEKDAYEKAVKTTKSHGCISSAYVMLKPDVMKEAAAFWEALSTIKYVLGVGADEVLLEPTLVAKGAPLVAEWEKGHFFPPSFWTIAALLVAAQGLGPVYLAEMTDAPPPIAASVSCPVCEKKIRKIFSAYRQSLNTEVLLDLPNCSCREIWEHEVGHEVSKYLP